jgi:hypothetical protein
MRGRTQEFRSCRSSGGKKMRREDKDSRPIYRPYSEELLPDWDGDRPGIHSATPELLNSCNSCNSWDYVRI